MIPSLAPARPRGHHDAELTRAAPPDAAPIAPASTAAKSRKRRFAGERACENAELRRGVGAALAVINRRFPLLFAGGWAARRHHAYLSPHQGGGSDFRARRPPGWDARRPFREGQIRESERGGPGQPSGRFRRGVFGFEVTVAFGVSNGRSGRPVKTPLRGPR